jgi:hypothetical protein
MHVSGQLLYFTTQHGFALGLGELSKRWSCSAGPGHAALVCVSCGCPQLYHLYVNSPPYNTVQRQVWYMLPNHSWIGWLPSRCA